jgi:RNA polymerase sigma-70 factor, ECF subfamily
VTATTDDDRRMIEAAQADPSRFVDLYDRYVDRVYAFVSSRTNNRGTAEDITAEVFHQALAHLGEFEWRGVPFSAWLFRMASNAIADRWRQSGREGIELPADVPDRRDAAEIERRVIVFQLVDRLPDLQRRVIELRFVEEKSIREIAVELGRSEGAVKQLQLRALDNLRKEMGRRG